MSGESRQTTSVIKTGVDYTLPFAGSLVPFCVFMLPVLNAVEIPLVGRLLLGEAACALLLPVLLINRGYLLTDRFPRMFLRLALIWLGMLILTDIARGTPFHDYARGWAKIGFFIIDFCVLYILVHDRPRYVFLLACGFAIGNLADYVLSPYPLASTAPWKFGIGPGVNLLVVIAVSYLNDICWKRTALLTLLLISIFNLYMGYRSAGGLLLLTAMYFLISPTLRRIPGKAAPFGVLITVVISVVISLILFNYIAHFMGNESLLAKQKSQSGKFSLLIGGRPELYTSALAIYESPLYGYGSWPRNDDYIYRLLDLRLYGYDIKLSENRFKEGYLPTHSYLLGAWVEAGIAGAVFWLVILFMVVHTLIDIPYITKLLSVLVIFKLFDFTWNILFSPFGIAGRFDAAFVIILMVMVYHGVKNERRLRTGA